jgi:hypothetical protein
VLLMYLCEAFLMINAVHSQVQNCGGQHASIASRDASIEAGSSSL